MRATIQSLKDQYAGGVLSKPDFIEQALDVHRSLFDYVDIVRSTDVREIRITAEGICFRVGEEDVWLYAPPGEARVLPMEVMNFGRYEPEEARIMDLLSAGAETILDVGSNIGWYAIRFAKRLPKALVHAFEPMPVSHAFLQRNVALNDVGNRVCCYNYGLSDKCGGFDFFMPQAGSVNASLSNVSGAKNASVVVGLTLTLDQWCANQRLQPDFIKCDVEGAELLVFRGASRTLAQARPVVFTELLRKWAKPFGYHPNDVLGFFEKLGYACYAIGSVGARRIERVTDETVETGYAFLHRDAHGALIRRLESLQ
jgi:FkbM family methyltransferase